MSNRLPPITITFRDHARLHLLAEVVWSKFPDVSEFLIRELDRAKLISPERVDPSTVTMGSQVEFAYLHSGDREIITLVFPSEENITMGKISVLTPVGAALIGLSESQSIAFQTFRGEKRTLIVLKVHQPAGD